MIQMMTNSYDVQWWVEEIIKDTQNEVFACVAGLGVGKTYGLCQVDYELKRHNPNSAFSFIVMPVYRLIESALIPRYRQAMASMGVIEDYHFKIVKSPYHKIVWATGQETHLISASRPQDLIASEFSHGSISEAGSIKKEVFELADTRIRDLRATQLKFILEGVPQGKVNWYAELFDHVDRKEWEKIARRDYVNKTSKYRKFRLTTYDNLKYLPENYIAKLLRIYKDQPAYIQAWVFGHFVDLAEGNVYYSYNPILHDISVDPSPYKDIHLTLDFNANPMSWVANQEYIFEEIDVRVSRMVAMREIADNVENLDDAITDFATTFPVHQYGGTRIKIYGDSSGHAKSHKARHSDYERIKKQLVILGYGRVSIEAITHNPLEERSSGCLNDWFAEDGLLVDRSCYKLKRSLLSTRFKTGTRKIDKPAGETHTHMGDAQKYFAYVYRDGKSSVWSRNI